jgi:hypothetical protein
MFAFLMVAACCDGQVPAAAGAELQLMASHAGVIFSGQVVAVAREDAAGFVDVRFRIDDAVRGCPKVGFYVLREWAGLWMGQPERYRVGQRRLMLLTARGPSGMSSPVGGVDGAIPLIASGSAPIADAAGVAPVDTGLDTGLGPATFAVDLRWIQARAVRTTGGSSANARVVAIGAPALPWRDSSGGDWAGPVVSLIPSASQATATPVTLGSVLTLLRGGSARAAGGVGDARY